MGRGEDEVSASTDFLGQPWEKLYAQAQRSDILSDGDDAERLSAWVRLVLLPRLQSRESAIVEMRGHLDNWIREAGRDPDSVPVADGGRLC